MSLKIPRSEFDFSHRLFGYTDAGQFDRAAVVLFPRIMSWAPLIPVFASENASDAVVFGDWLHRHLILHIILRSMPPPVVLGEAQNALLLVRLHCTASPPYRKCG
jgi:hypothetical protein